MSKIKIALVGCGRISRKHFNAIYALSDQCTLHAICDISEDRLDSALRSLHEIDNIHFANNEPKRYSSYEVLLADIGSKLLDIDLVVLTTPSGLHPQQVIKASQVGVNVCTEKPMATRLSDGVNMVKACDSAGVQLFVVKQNRFNPTLQLLKKQLIAGRFGRLSMISVNVFWQRPQSYYDQDEWRGTWEFDGGALMNQASHYVDLLEWLVGPILSVSAYTATIDRDIEVEDTAALNLAWRNGALGTMSVTMLTYPQNLEGSITILGTRGSVKVGGTAVNKIDYWDFEDKSQDDELVDDVGYDTSSVYGNGHTPYYSDMINSLVNNSPAECDGREGLKSLELLIAAYRSARSGKTMHLPLSL